MITITSYTNKIYFVRNLHFIDKSVILNGDFPIFKLIDSHLYTFDVILDTYI